MMKKLTIFMLLLVTAIFTVATPVRADVGPKSSVELTIIGAPETYAFDFLIPLRWSMQDDFYEGHLDNYYLDVYPEALIGYQDSDYFASCFLYSNAPCYFHFVEAKSGEDGDVFRHTYFSAPKTFKAVIVTDEGHIITSPELNRTLFDARVTWDLTGVDLTQPQSNAGTISESYPVGAGILDFLLRLTLTVVIELGILFLFMYRKRESYLFVLKINIITQTLLTLGILLAYYFTSIFGAIALLFIGEIVVITVETVLYGTHLPKTEKKVTPAIIYGVTANLISAFAMIFLFYITHLLSGRM